VKAAFSFHTTAQITDSSPEIHGGAGPAGCTTLKRKLFKPEENSPFPYRLLHFTKTWQNISLCLL